jgi:hypothetical protein
MINISRKRLCGKASPETREAWILALKRLKEIDSPLYFACVPECFYRGFCPELKSCGRCKKSYFEEALTIYRGV